MRKLLRISEKESSGIVFKIKLQVFELCLGVVAEAGVVITAAWPKYDSHECVMVEREFAEMIFH
jgi:hypothetical protein